jgi:hypothetical protein
MRVARDRTSCATVGDGDGVPAAATIASAMTETG